MPHTRLAAQSSLRANKLRSVDCRGTAAPYGPYETVSSERAGDKLAADRRTLLDRLRALHALSRGRAIDGRTCLPGRTKHVALLYAPDHHRAVHVFRFWLGRAGGGRSEFAEAIAFFVRNCARSGLSRSHSL